MIVKIRFPHQMKNYIIYFLLFTHIAKLNFNNILPKIKVKVFYELKSYEFHSRVYHNHIDVFA